MRDRESHTDVNVCYRRTWRVITLHQVHNPFLCFHIRFNVALGGAECVRSHISCKIMC